MGIMDIFHASKIKKENERLLTELEDAKKLLTPEMKAVIAELGSAVGDRQKRQTCSVEIDYGLCGGLKHYIRKNWWSGIEIIFFHNVKCVKKSQIILLTIVLSYKVNTKIWIFKISHRQLKAQSLTKKPFFVRNL